MKIKQDGRDYAATLRMMLHRARSPPGMDAMSEKFNAMGQQVYVDAENVKESNKVL